MKRLLGLIIFLLAITVFPHFAVPQTSDARPNTFNRDAFVEILIVSPEEMSYGSGSIIEHRKDSSIVLTVKHLCKSRSGLPLSNLRLFRVGRDDKVISAKVLSVSSETDLCALETNKPVDRPLMDLARNGPTYGNQYYHLGSPVGTAGPDFVPILDGRYSGTKDIPGSERRFDGYTVPAKQGSSGGPVINSNGRIVGVVSRVLRGYPHITMSPRYKDVKAFVKGLP